MGTETSQPTNVPGRLLRGLNRWPVASGADIKVYYYTLKKTNMNTFLAVLAKGGQSYGLV